ncbi:predicted protein [Streptomyces sp. C]|nr:predicted protein [Streptomyces sp. C]
MGREIYAPPFAVRHNENSTSEQIRTPVPFDRGKRALERVGTLRLTGRPNSRSVLRDQRRESIR